MTDRSASISTASAKGSERREQSAAPMFDAIELNTRQHEEGVVMKVVTLKDIPNAPMEGAERIEGYTGPVSRSRQTIVQPGTPRIITVAW